jgi:hypothetical protein
MKRFESSPERQVQMTKLAEYFGKQPDGEELSWLRIESETGISMKPRGHGRPLVWKTLRRINRPYEAVIGEAIRLSAPNTALTIVRNRFIRIDGAVRNADKTQRILQDRHLNQMTADEQRKMIISASFFATIRMIAKENEQRILR